MLLFLTNRLNSYCCQPEPSPRSIIAVFGPTLDPSAMALMTDGEIPLTNSTNLLGPNSLVPITPYLDYGHQSMALAASSYPAAMTETDLQRLRSSGRKKSRHKKSEPSCTNSYSNNSFDYSNMDSCAPQPTMEMYRAGSFRPSSSSGRMRRAPTTTGRIHKYTTK